MSELPEKSATSVSTLALTVIVILLFALYIFLKRHFSYWKQQNVPYIEPEWFFGNVKQIFTMTDNPAELFQKLYLHPNAKNQPVVGIYSMHKPGLIIREPELIKLVLVKEFNKFCNRYSSCDPHSDPLGSDNLFLVKNPRWKEIRTKLTPVYTSGKLKQMFPLIEEIGRQLDAYLSDLTAKNATKRIQREVKELNALYTTDVIASVAYGLQADSFKNPDGDFRRNGKSVFDFNWYRALEFNCMFFLPQVMQIFGFKVFSKEATHFIRNTFNYAMQERIRTGQKRNDLIDALVAFKKYAEDEKGGEHFILEGDALVAQAAIFFTAGFETTSSTISFALYELSRKPEILKRLRAEIHAALANTSDGRLTYDMINDMSYLQMVVQEVLRLYPPLPFLDRECTLSKGEEPYSLEPHCDFAIPHGMPVFIPVYALQRDAKYFPNPDEFDPERFSPQNKQNIPAYAYMPFGSGPHNCIGERFGLINSKVGLINFLRNHRVEPCEKSHPKMQLEPKALIIQSKGGIYLNIVSDPMPV